MLFRSKSLGYAGDIMLVAHSLGGFYATLYASRHPQHVKAAVLIDANPACFFTDDYLARNLISLSMFETDGYDESSLIGSGNQKAQLPFTADPQTGSLKARSPTSQRERRSAQNRIEKRLEDSVAVRAVCHDEEAVAFAEA